MTNWGNFKCRCSGIHKILANSRSNPVLTEKQTLRLIELEAKESLTEKMVLEMTDLLVKKGNSSKVILSDTAITYLMETYAWATYKKKPLSEMFEVKQMQKGKLAEEDAIDLISRVDRVLYTKNDERIENDFLSGEPDIFTGDNIMNAGRITDIKNCWDYPIFLQKINGGLDNGNEEQVQGYMDITGAQEGEIAFTLVDMPEIMRDDFKRKLFYDGDYVTEESIEFKKKWEELEHSMTFGEIPIHQRAFRIKIEPFSEIKKQQVYDRVKVCREWLWKFDEMYQKLNIPVGELEIVT